ncbi:preprotein translocase subunit SecG [Desulfonatronum thiosulfatophilum]|uniref:Protein-export membrane protein SecG n=1 Tax=Desulfonatronum thiosulfatophilum TaxID=617002 RepID=A0A1G6CLV2_9BACT|nr:preprotein translocase subunit SecG [Desulfonatronum thiosulfatophilum]SDB33846.1 preprotein translocase subunit SecG [Desulfonatronum thiosulfatophilum]
MSTLIITIHILACISLVVLILLQSGKEGMGVIFGGGSSSVFGGGGAGGLLKKLTISVASVFLITSLSFTYMSGQRTAEESIILDIPGDMLQVPSAPGTIEQQILTPREPADSNAPQQGPTESQ